MAKFLVIQKQREIPIAPEVMKAVLPAQFAYLKQLQAQGKIEALYGFATEKGGCGIINAASHEELQRAAFNHPAWPFITWEIHPLTSIEDTEKAAKEMLSRLP